MGGCGLPGGLEGLSCLAECDEGDVFLGCVREERFDGAEPQCDRLGGVAPLVVHPCQPCLEVLAVEVVEADLFGLNDVLVVGEVAEKAFQADPVGLDRLGGEPPSRFGHVGMEVVTGEDEEVGGAGYAGLRLIRTRPRAAVTGSFGRGGRSCP